MKRLNKDYIQRLLPKRPINANKGTFGKVLVIAGSKNFPGAAYLVCAACYRVGVGLVTLVTKDIVKIIVSKKLPEVTFLNYNEVFNKINDYGVLLIGPGLGQSDQAIKFVKEFCNNYSNNRTKILIDGDGLNILSNMGNWWENLSGEVVLTPHPGEMSRLTGLSIEEIQSARVDIAGRYAKRWRMAIVLKGAKTVIASPGGEVREASFANPVLATAGTGDVLSGIIAGFLAQGLTNFDAACLGVFVHGLAGELLKKDIGTGAIASDLLPLLPKTIKSLKNN